jgi:hypothetical protein
MCSVGTDYLGFCNTSIVVSFLPGTEAGHED